MLHDIASGRIQALIISKLARLARNTKELLEFAEHFRRHGADIVSLQERVDTTSPAGRLFYTIIAAMAQWEREEIVERVRASVATRAKLGRSLGGAAPFGYEWANGDLTVRQSEAVVRKLMFEWFAEDRRSKSVARRLNDSGYRTRKGAKFTDTTVVRLIRDPSAKGLYRSNHTRKDAKGKIHPKPEAEWVHTPVPAIVSEDLWERCNAILARRKDGRPPGPKPVHLFAGIVRCGCGQPMYVFTRTSKYICRGCRAKIPMEDLEQIFREELHAFTMSVDRVEGLLAESDAHLEEKRQRLEVHKTELARVRTEMRKVYALYQGDQISAEGFGALYKPLEAQERALAAETPRLEGELDALSVNRISASAVVAESVDLYRTWPELSSERKRAIIESVVEAITISGSEIDVTYSYLPSSEEMTTRQRTLTGSWQQPR
jgi:site-specific DNA recombinase